MKTPYYLWHGNNRYMYFTCYDTFCGHCGGDKNCKRSCPICWDCYDKQFNKQVKDAYNLIRKLFYLKYYRFIRRQDELFFGVIKEVAMMNGPKPIYLNHEGQPCQ